MRSSLILLYQGVGPQVLVTIVERVQLGYDNFMKIAEPINSPSVGIPFQLPGFFVKCYFGRRPL